MSEGVVLIAAFIAVVALFWWLLYVTMGAERHARFVARWVHFLAQHWQAPRHRIARMLLPMTLWITWLLTGVAALGVLVPRQPDEGPPSAPLVTLLVMWLAGVVALGVVALVVARTGRPSRLVVNPCRGMTPDEIEAWIDATAAWPRGY